MARTIWDMASWQSPESHADDALHMLYQGGHGPLIAKAHWVAGKTGGPLGRRLRFEADALSEAVAATRLHVLRHPADSDGLTACMQRLHAATSRLEDTLSTI